MAGDVLEADDGLLWVRDEAAACSEVRVEEVVCSDAEEEVAACSRAKIEDGRWQRHDSV
jgi:hypothetical protein